MKVNQPQLAVLCLVLLYSVTAPSEDFHSPENLMADSYDVHLLALLKVKSKTDLERVVDQGHRHDWQRRACRAELRAERTPVHCLRFLGDQSEVATAPNEDRQRWTAMISRLCQRAVSHEEDISEIHTVLASLGMDRDCFEAAKKRQERLEYMHPELLTEAFSDRRP